MADTAIPDEPFRAFVVEQQDGEVMRRVESLAPDDLPDGDVTIEVTWSSVNYKDALATIPKGGVARLPRLVPGIDLAGRVVASAEPAIPVGDEVLVTGHGLGVSHHGGWAAYARVPAAWVLALPDGLTARQAMTLGTAGLTAGLSLEALEHHGLAPGSGPVLVLGASGGVGSIAVGALATAGYEVWALTGKPDQADALRALGAHEVVGRELLEDGAGRPLAKARWAGAVDPIGGPGTAYLMRTMRYGGAIAVSGLTAGAGLETTVLPLILRGVSLLGIDSVDAAPELRRTVWHKLATTWRPRELEPSSEVTLDTIEPVLDDLLAARARGRTVVRL